MTAKIGILTDNLAQFTTHTLEGQDLISVIPMNIRHGGNDTTGGTHIYAKQLPRSLLAAEPAEMIFPTLDEFVAALTNMNRKYEEVIAIFSSARFTPFLELANQAVEKIGTNANITVIDSETTSVSLGMLVEQAAKAAIQGQNATEIKRHLKKLIPHVYGLFCVCGLSYLQKMDLISYPQAVVGEKMKIKPFFAINQGQLEPVQKARNARQLTDAAYEFVAEFGDLHHIALMQGAPPLEQELKGIRERIIEEYPDVSISEHTINAFLASIIGPQSLGIFLFEKEDGIGIL